MEFILIWNELFLSIQFRKVCNFSNWTLNAQLEMDLIDDVSSIKFAFNRISIKLELEFIIRYETMDGNICSSSCVRIFIKQDNATQTSLTLYWKSATIIRTWLMCLKVENTKLMLLFNRKMDNVGSFAYDHLSWFLCDLQTLKAFFEEKTPVTFSMHTLFLVVLQNESC